MGTSAWGGRGNVNLGEREDRLFFSYRSTGRLKQANFLQGFVPNLHRAEGIEQGRGQFYFFISKISPCNTFRSIISVFRYQVVVERVAKSRASNRSDSKKADSGWVG